MNKIIGHSFCRTEKDVRRCLKNESIPVGFIDGDFCELEVNITDNKD